MFTIKTLNKIFPEGLTALDKEHYTVSSDADSPDGIIVRSADMLSSEFDQKLRAIARAGAGTNNIPCERCACEGIVVFNTPGANANAVKEIVLCALFLASRDIVGGIRWVESLAGNEQAEALVEKEKNRFAGPELAGKTLGVIGLGAIGARVADAAISLGMTVYGYDPFLSVETAWGLNPSIHCAKDLNTIYAKSDYITLHVPQTADTKGVINSQALSSMKQGVSIINIARGGLVNNKDLFAAIESGKVSRYVTDFPDAELIGKKNVICIPHLGASTPESEENCACMAVQELKDFLENGNIRNSVNFPAVRLEKSAPHRISVIYKDLPELQAKISEAITAAGCSITAFAGGTRKGISYALYDVSELPELPAIEGVIRVTNIY